MDGGIQQKAPPFALGTWVGRSCYCYILYNIL